MTGLWTRDIYYFALFFILTSNSSFTDSIKIGNYFILLRTTNDVEFINERDIILENAKRVFQ